MGRLVLPSSKYQTTYLEALQEHAPEPFHGRLKVLAQLHGPDFPRFYTWISTHFPQFISELTSAAHYYWYLDRGKYVGNVVIRSAFPGPTPAPPGHIGYYVRPSKRSRGYGRILLGAGMKKAFSLGIKPILITCSTDNLPSQHVIRDVGGRLDKPLSRQFPGKLCYWVG